MLEVRGGPAGPPRLHRLQVTVELAPGVQADTARAGAATASILAHLRRLNSEFANYTPAEYQRPDVILRPYGDPGYFPPGAKHRYSRTGATAMLRDGFPGMPVSKDEAP